MTNPVGEHSAPGAVSREVPAPRRRSDATEVLDSSGTGIVLGELSSAARPRIAEILWGTRLFSRAEIDVALEVFDERGPDYLVPTLNEPRWLFFVRPLSMMTWQGVDWHRRYKHYEWGT